MSKKVIFDFSAFENELVYRDENNWFIQTKSVPYYTSTTYSTTNKTKKNKVYQYKPRKRSTPESLAKRPLSKTDIHWLI